MGVLVKECMKTNFNLLSESLPLGKAISQLTDNNYGVVIDSNGEPVALVSADNLKKARDSETLLLKDFSANLPLIVIIGCMEEMRKLNNVSTLFDVGNADGAVVFGEERVIVGVLPSTKIYEYLSDEYTILSKEMGLSGSVSDSILGGEYQTPLGRVKCKECGFINSIYFLDRNNLPCCQNKESSPHKLSLP